MEFLILLLFGFALIWLFVVLPQRRRQAQHDAMVSGLSLGDEVVTAGGIYGTVTRLREDEVSLEIAEGVEVRVARRAVAARLSEDEDEEGDAEAEAADEDVPAVNGEETR